MIIIQHDIGWPNNPLICIFLYSHYLSACFCIDIVRRNSVLVTHGSKTVKNGWKPLFISKGKFLIIFLIKIEYSLQLMHQQGVIVHLIIITSSSHTEILFWPGFWRTVWEEIQKLSWLLVRNFLSVSFTNITVQWSAFPLGLRPHHAPEHYMNVWFSLTL